AFFSSSFTPCRNAIDSSLFRRLFKHGGEGGNKQGQQGKASEGEERASESPCETESQRGVMKSSDKPPKGSNSGTLAAESPVVNNRSDGTVEEPKFLFEAKTVQRMELLVLSTLQWRMNPVTPISFFEHIVRRIGLKTLLHWEFLWRCQRVLLSVIPNSRFMGYLPSTLDAATMIHVIKEIEPLNAMEYINQLMGLLKTSEVCVLG
ncbi:hypothetical protein S83_043392, partial [Arachis hypogaea]